MMNELGMGVVVSMKDMFTQNAHRIQSAMTTLDTTVAGAAESMQRNMQLIQRGTMMMGAGMALLAVPTVVVASTIRTQKALGEMASVGVKDLAALSKAAEEFSNVWGGMAKAEFIAAAYDIKGGINSLSDVAVGEYTKIAALTAKATKASVAEMTSLFATGYGIYRDMYSKMSDIEFGELFSGGVASAVQVFKTTGAGMSSAISALGAAATTANVPLEEQLAILGMLQATMSGSEAGTKYRAFMKSAAEAGKELNLEFVDENNNLLGMVAILKKLRDRYGDTLDAMEKMEVQKAFGRAEAVAVVDLFYQKVGDLNGNIRIMNDSMRQGTRYTLEMAQAMNMDIGSRLSVVSQQFHNLLEIMGELLLPVVMPIISGISQIIRALQRAAKACPNLTRGILVLSAALGAVLVAVGGVMAAAGLVGIMLPAIKAGLIAIGGALAGLGSAVATYLLPITAIVVGVVAAVYLLYKAWQTNFGGIRDIVMGAYERIKAVFQGVWQLVSSLAGGTGRISAELASKLKAMGLWEFVKTVFMVFHRAREYVVGYWTAIGAAFRKVAKILEPPIRALLSAYAALYKAIFSIVGVFGVVGTAADGSSFRSLGTTIGTVIGVIAQVAAYVIKFIIYPMSWVIRIVAAVVRAIVWLVKVIVEGTVFALKFLYKFTLPFRMLIDCIVMVAKVAYTLWQVLTGDISIVAGFRKIGDAVLHYLGAPFRWARDVASASWGFLQRLFASGVAFFTRAADLIASVFLKLPVVQTLLGIWQSVRAFFSGDKTFFEAGRGILLAIGRGILSTITLPFRLIGQAFAWVRRLLPFSDAQEGPLSSLTESGRAIILTICKGILSVAALPLRILGGVFSGALRFAGAIWSGLKSVVRRGWDAIRGADSGVLGVLTAPLRLGLSVAGKVWSGLRNAAATGWNALKAAGSKAMSFLPAPFQRFAGAAVKAWGGVIGAGLKGWESLKGRSDSAVGMLTAPFRIALGVGRAIWSGVKDVAAAGWDLVKSVGAAAWSTVSAPFGFVVDAASSAWSAIQNAAGTAWEGMKSATGSAWAALSTPLAELRTVAGNAWDWIAGKASAAWGSITEGASNALNAVSGFASSAWTAGKSILGSVADGVKAVINAPYEAVKDAFSAVRRLLPFSDAQEGPLSNLTSSGRAMIETLAGGMQEVAKLPATAFSKMWGFVAGLGKAVVSPLIQPSITPLAPVDVTANSLAVQPQVDARGILSRIPVIGGLIERVRTGLSDWSGSLLGGLSEVWTRYAAFWDMMRAGAQDTVAALRQAAATTLPAILAGTLSLTPVLAAELPTPATVTTTAMRAVETPTSTMVAPMAMRVPEAVVMEMPELALPVLGPSAAVAAIAEKPVPSVVKEREIERTRLLVEHAGASVPAEHGKAAPGEPETSMGALMAKLDEIAERPVDINLTVVSKLDGRIIAQAVYKDIRQQKIKNYETL